MASVRKTGDATWLSRSTAWLAARSFRQIVLGAGAVVLIVSGAFGGLKEAEADRPVALRADVAHLSDPVTITIRGVHWSDDLGEAIGKSERGRYLLVIADVSTDHDASVDSFVVRETLRMQGLQGFAKNDFGSDVVASEEADPRVLVTDDRTRLSELGPGLTYEVAFIWEQELSEPLPTSVSLVTRAHTYRQSSLDDQSNWFGIADDAVGTFPVTKFGGS